MPDAASNLDQELNQAIAKLCADSGTIHVKDGDELVLHLVASCNVPPGVVDAIREVPWGKGMAGLAAQREEPADYCDIQSSTSPDIHPLARASGVRGAVVVPMMNGTEVVGTIGIGSRNERTFSAQEIRWLLAFGRRLANDFREDRMAA